MPPFPRLAYCSQAAMRAEVPAPPKPLAMHVADMSMAELLDWGSAKLPRGLLVQVVNDASAYLMARSLGDDEAARAALRSAKIKHDLVEGVL